MIPALIAAFALCVTLATLLRRSMSKTDQVRTEMARREVEASHAIARMRAVLVDPRSNCKLTKREAWVKLAERAVQEADKAGFPH